MDFRCAGRFDKSSETIVLTSAGVSYERSQLTQFSVDVDPTHATIVIIALTTIKALARVLAAWLKERKRRIVVVKTLDGSQLEADNCSIEEVERLLRAASEHSDGHIYIVDSKDKPNGSN